jgi:hypothetical protein
MRLDAFLELVAPYGCRYFERPGRFGPRGPAQWAGIIRTVGGYSMSAQLPPLIDGDLLTSHVARSILVQLGLDPGEFGF